MYFKNIPKFKSTAINKEDLDMVSDNNLISDLVQQSIQEIDDMYYKFLTKNGYKIDKPYNINQLEEIVADLAKQDKFLDYLSYVEYKNNTIISHLLPFFNCISNPLSEEAKEDIIRRWKNVNTKS